VSSWCILSETYLVDEIGSCSLRVARWMKVADQCSRQAGVQCVPGTERSKEKYHKGQIGGGFGRRRQWGRAEERESGLLQE
jgi:hypothetical protein